MDKIRKKRKRPSQDYAVSPKARAIVILIGEEKDSDTVWVQNLKYELDLLISPHANFTIRIVSVERMSIVLQPNVVDDWHYVINRVPESSRSNIAKTSLAILRYCELFHIKVYNPYNCFLIGQNKILHHAVLSALGLRSPVSVLVRDMDSIKSIIKNRTLEFPVLLKPNAGGYGKGIQKFECKEELLKFCRENTHIDRNIFGMDGSALIQHCYGSSQSPDVYRVWLLNGSLQCAIKVERPRGGFSGACMSDACSAARTIVTAVDVTTLDEQIKSAILKIGDFCGADCCSIEYLLDTFKSKQEAPKNPIYFDVNMLSTLPTNKPEFGIINSQRVWGTRNFWKELADDIFKKIPF